MALNGVMATRHHTNYRTLASLSRINLLHELQQRGSQTVTELAKATGLHHNTAREHLHRLIDAGFVRSEPIPTTTKGRPKILYRAANRRSDLNGQSRIRAAQQRTERVRKLLPVHEVSHHRSPMDEQLDMLDDHMDQCGFDAVIQSDGERMTMHDCPFAELARDNPQVCEVHFELAKDSLRMVDGPVEARALYPFTTPNDCVLKLDTGSADYEAANTEN